MAWYDPTFAYKKAVVIPHSNVTGGSDLQDFPLLLSFTDTALKSISNGGYVISPSGYDLLFTDGTETRELAYEVESYTASSGAIVAWVRVPILSASQDTVIYLYFGNSTVSGFQATASNVWNSNYVGVWHMSDNAATTTIKDSTANANNATAAANTSGKSVTGEIASGLTFNGSTDYASVALNLSSTKTLSLSFWLNWTTNTNNDALAMEFTSNYTGSTGGFRIDPNSSTYASSFEIDVKGDVGSNIRSFTQPSAGSWHFYTIVLDKTVTAANEITVYVDGTAQSTTLQVSNANANAFANSTLYLMSRSNASLFGTGSLDELRVYKGSRPANWVATEYTNQSNPSSFIVLGQLIPNVGTADISLLNTSSVTTAQSSVDQLNVGARGVTLVFNSTVQPGDDPVTVVIQGKDIVSGQYYTVASFPNLSLGTSMLALYPGLQASSTVVDGVLPRTWRVTVTPTTSESASYTVGASLLR